MTDRNGRRKRAKGENALKRTQVMDMETRADEWWMAGFGQ